MANIELSIDAQIGQIKQRIDDLQVAKRSPPDDLTGSKIRSFQESIETEISRLDTSAFLIRERGRALDDAKVVVAALTDEDLAATNAALELLDKEVRHDQAADALLALFPELTKAASKVVFAVGAGQKKA